jgi:putative oxidoreductase
MNIVRLSSSLINPAWLASHFARWSPLPLRLIVGYGFMAHGYAKIIKNPENFVAILHALNVPAPHFMAWATIAIELLGGFAIFIGAFVPLVSVPMTAVLLVATLTVHLQFGFTSIKLMSVTAAGPQFGPPGYETDLLYFACLVALVFGGAGPLAVDNLLPWRKATLPLAIGTPANGNAAR